MEIVYYVAMSLDGFIATPDGGIDWLPDGDNAEGDFGYAEFYGSIDGVILGGNTFRQIQTFGEYPYSGKPAWVLTHRPVENAPSEVLAGAWTPHEVVTQANQRALIRLWLVGGGTVAQQFREAGLITEYYLSIMPILLGAGIPFLKSDAGLENLRHLSTQTYPSGVVQVRYGKPS
jgi:dihydrofolate reductase